jgi:hypothetical protein
LGCTKSCRRSARALAALNHPHIAAQIDGIDERPSNAGGLPPAWGKRGRKSGIQ